MRGKLILISILAIITVVSIVVIWTQITPKYQAQAKVIVRPIIPYLVFQSENSGLIPLYDSFVKTQISIITNMTVLQRVKTDVLYLRL